MQRSFCKVYGCSNSDPLTADNDAQYYFFPRHPVLIQHWIEASGWPELSEADLNDATICSLHFGEECYTTEIEITECDEPIYTKSLKYNAVPTQFLPSSNIILLKQFPIDNNEIENVGTSEEITIRFPSISPLNSNAEIITENNKEEQNINNTQIKTELIDLEKYKNIQTIDDLMKLKNSNNNMQKTIEFLRSSIDETRKLLETKKLNLQNTDKELYKMQKYYGKIKHGSLSLAQQKQLLLKVFSESQLKILSGRKRVYWSDNDMAIGYTIRHLSNKRCYGYLTKKLNIPLPGISSIKRWTVNKLQNKKEESAEGE